MRENLPQSAPALSIVVPVRDGWEETFQTLMALVTASPPVPKEIIVVDDGSLDESRLALPRLPGIVLHRNDEPIGLVHAANQGAALAQSPYILFLTAGALPGKDSFLPLLNALLEDEGLSAVAPTLKDPSGAEMEGAPTTVGGEDAPFLLASLPLQGLLVRASTLRAQGGFDASFKDRLAEFDLCWRIKDRGGRIKKVKEAVLDLSFPGFKQASAEDLALLEERWGERASNEGQKEPTREPVDPEDAMSASSLADPMLPLEQTARLNASPSGEKDPSARKLAVCSLIADTDGTYEIELRLEDGKKRRGGKVRRAYSAPAADVQVPFLPEGWKRTVSPEEIVSFFANGYDFERESARYARARKEGEKARIAFTAVRADLMGGGSINLFRIANWLVDLGAEVGIYADSLLPSWTKVNAHFHAIADQAERYLAIEEDVVVAYSSLELQKLLRHCDHRGKRIYHLCQGAEEFHYASETPPPLLCPNGLFDLLNAVPVGRIVVSPHLERYFAEKYGQRSVSIVNGVDLETFRPRGEQKKLDRGELTVLVSGHPYHPLKGISVVKEALALVARRRPQRKLRLLNLCGMRLPLPGLLEENGITIEMKMGLTPPEVRDQLVRADAYVNASWYEGFGLPSLEAMACGVPVVQTENHGLSGIVQDGRDCLTVPPQDPEAIASALERLVEDPALRSRITLGGRATAQRHSLERQKERTRVAFSEITMVPLRPEPSRTFVEVEGERPRFSVLVPTYNQAQFLPAALDSLLAQTDRDFEALVINDGSTDSTPEVMARYASQDRRIRCLHKENGGVASALNRGLEKTRGDWILWLSSDDLFLPEKLSLHREAARADPGLRFMHTNFLLLHERTGQATHSGIPEGFIPPLPQQVVRFLRINYVNGISIAIHRSVFDNVGGFDEEFRYGQDYDLWLRASARYRSTFLDRATCVTRLHPSQGTALFTEAGIYDSARAAASFLVKHRLLDLFPAQDLTQPAQALQALSALLSIAHSPDAFIVRCGFASLLEERLKEWLGGLPERLRFLVNQEIEVALAHQQKPEVQTSLKGLTRTAPGYRFRPKNPFSLLEEHLARLARRGEAAEHAAVKRYLEMIADTKTRGKLARAS